MDQPYRLAVLNSHPIQYFAPLYRDLADSGEIDITVYYCSDQGISPARHDAGFSRAVVWDVPLLQGYRYRMLPNLRADRGPRGFFSLMNVQIVPELAREKYDAIWIHGHNYFANILAMLAAKATGTRVFMRGETHLRLHRSAIRRILRRPALSLLYRLCDAFLYIGSLNRDFYAKQNVPPAKLFFVPYAVDNEFFSGQEQTARDPAVPHDMPVILFASKFIPRKRPMDLIRAYAGLRESGVRATLVLIGAGPLREVLESHVREHSIPDVYFAGFRNQSELPAYYRQAYLFVLPSENEPWGLVVNEVMCAGLPVVATNEVGAATDLVTEATGIVYPAGDVAALERALRTLVESPALRDAMSRNCIATMRTWSFRECREGIGAALRQRPPRVRSE